MTDPDFEALRRMRAETPPPSDELLRSVRERLEDHIAAAERPAVLMRAGRPASRHRASRRPAAYVMRAGAAAAAVAVIAGGAYALTDDPSNDRAADGPGPSTSPQSSTGPAVVRFVNAAQVLDAAAAGAAKDTASPGPGEYRRVSRHSLDVTTVEEPPHDGAYELTENRSDTWTPASGVGYERVRNDITVRYPTAEQRRYAKGAPGGIPEESLTWYEVDADGNQTQVYPTHEDPIVAEPCRDCPDSIWDDPDDADLDSISRDPAALRSSLYTWARQMRAEVVKYGKGDQLTTDDLAYDGVTGLVTRPDVPGELRSALYQVTKTIPGILLIDSLANYDGVTGVAVGRIDSFDVQHDLIFTGNGSTYIGDRTIARKPSREFHVAPDTLLGASAVTVSITGKPDVPRR